MSTAKGRRGVYEADVEQYLKKRVTESGGMCSLITGRGFKGCPDALITWPRDGWAQLHLIEVKTTGGALDPWQENDHKARKRLNCHVRVIWTKQMVDEYVAEYGARPKPDYKFDLQDVPQGTVFGSK